MRHGFYFGAGPAALPTSVVEKAAAEFIEYENLGVGLGEMSHRSGQAGKIVDDTKQQIKELLKVPDTYEVMFVQGGGTGGFASVLYALAAYKYVQTQGKGAQLKGDYIVTGAWSTKAKAEAERLGFHANVIGKCEKFVDIPEVKESHGDYLYYCDNETVHGIEIPGSATTPPVENKNAVTDISSNMFSRPVDVSKYAIIFGGAQKNLGIPGVTLYIVRKDIIEALQKVKPAELHAAGIPVAPSFLDLGLAAANNSCYNTVSIFAIEVIKLVTAEMLAKGGVEAQTKISTDKAKKIYDAVDSRKDVYVTSIAPKARSRMNVVFNLNDSEQEAKFLKLAAERDLSGLKGHRSVGGIRVSNYNAITPEGAEAITKLILEFSK